MPCDHCGESVDRADEKPHRCDTERWAEYQLFGLRPEIDEFEERWRAYVDSTHGQFEIWFAARRVRGEY